MTNDEFVDGAGAAAEILSRMTPENRERIVKAISLREPETAIKIEEKLYDFEQVSQGGSGAIKELVRSVPQRDLALALKGSSPETKSAIISQLPADAGRVILERLTKPEPATLADIEAAQRRVLDQFRFLRKQAPKQESEERPKPKKEIWV